MNNNKTVGIFTLGCRVNQYESCAISEELQKRGYIIKKRGDCDFYIVNTCAVTAESERKSRQLVRRCASKGKVAVIGCASQIVPDVFDIDNVIYIGGNGNKMNVIKALENNDGCCISVVDLNGIEYENIFLTGEGDLFSECRAFIKIQDGCNGKCTYCIIPKCRGTVRSRDANEIIEEAKLLVNNGYKELILTGIEVSAYNKIPLAELIKKVSAIQGLKRLRLGSLSPNVINKRFLEIVSECKCFMPHIHLSLQSCSDRILTLMKRPYRKAQIIERIELIRQFIPNCMISADIIVGFPGETEDDFKETVELLEQLNVFHIHSFPYSERKGTPAAIMPNSVPKDVRTERNLRLIGSYSRTKKRIMDSKQGSILTVLVEKIVCDFAFGHTEEFFEAKLKNQQFEIGDIVDIRVAGNVDGVIVGECIR